MCTDKGCCLDSDGDDENTFGSVKIGDDEFYDCCSDANGNCLVGPSITSNYIKEYYCDMSGEKRYMVYECEDGYVCKDGYCQPST